VECPESAHRHFLAISVPVAAQAQDAWIGTWKLNLAKSKYDPANLAPKSQTVKLEAVAGGGMKGTVDGVDAQGKPSHQEYMTMFDGKSSEITGAPDANTTRVYKRIDKRTFEYVQSVGGKLTTTARTVIAADGKTRTTTTTGKNAQGQTVNNVALYDRQ
jgi:histidinol dehydrogenase